MLCGHEEKENSTICDNVDRAWGHYVKWNKPVLLLFTLRVTSGVSVRPHGLQPARPPCPSQFPRVCPSSSSVISVILVIPVIPSSHLIFWRLFSSCPQSFPTSGTFVESAVCIRWPKYWSFSFNISPSSTEGLEISQYRKTNTAWSYLYMES